MTTTEVPYFDSLADADLACVGDVCDVRVVERFRPDGGVDMAVGRFRRIPVISGGSLLGYRWQCEGKARGFDPCRMCGTFRRTSHSTLCAACEADLKAEGRL